MARLAAHPNRCPNRSAARRGLLTHRSVKNVNWHFTFEIFAVAVSDLLF
jgi:hypothetical protein